MKLKLGVACVALWASACAPSFEDPTFETGSAWSDSTGLELVHFFERYRDEFPQPKYSYRLDSSWLFVRGDSSETLLAEIKLMNDGNLINLPHRILDPNRALWYQKKVTGFTEDGFLLIRADDGAQVFSNGVRVHSLNGNFFPIKQADSIVLTIRVLNNAMMGGLRSVDWLDKQQWNDYQRDLIHFQKRKLLEHKRILSKSYRNSVDSEINSYDDHYPLLSGPWMVQTRNNHLQVRCWMENKREVTFRYQVLNEPVREITKECEQCTFNMPTGVEEFNYQIIADKTVTEVIQVSKPDTTAFQFHVWADSQSGWFGFFKNMKHAQNGGDAFGVGVGDLVGNGSREDEWRFFLSLLSVAGSNVPYYLIAGNHDYDGYYDDLQPKLYQSLIHETSYQSWYFSNCAFIALDPNQQFPIGFDSPPTQREWFLNEIQSEAWRKATWRFVFVHQPPLSQRWQGYEGDEAIQELLFPVLGSAKIDFVIAGHTHDYERLSRTIGDQETTFLVVGGGGGSLEPPESSAFPKMDTVIKKHHLARFYVNGKNVQFKVIGIDGEILEEFERAK